MSAEVVKQPAPSLPLDRETMDRWGIAYDAALGNLTLAPRVVPGERVARCPPFRAGRTVVALECRQRPSTVVLRVGITFGPPIRIEAHLQGAPAETTILVDEVPLQGPRVAFEARGDHDVAWLTDIALLAQPPR